jgi:hypothetical protein
VNGATAHIVGQRSALELKVQEPAEAVFVAVSLAEACLVNRREGVLTRLTVNLPAGVTYFRLQITPQVTI